MKQITTLGHVGPCLASAAGADRLQWVVCRLCDALQLRHHVTPLLLQGTHTEIDVPGAVEAMTQGGRLAGLGLHFRSWPVGLQLRGLQHCCTALGSSSLPQHKPSRSV